LNSATYLFPGGRALKLVKVLTLRIQRSFNTYKKYYFDHCDCCTPPQWD